MKQPPNLLNFLQQLTNNFPNELRNNFFKQEIICEQANNHHIPYLYQALELAKTYRGFTSPNPAVGALIVDLQGKIIATGSHRKSGFPHAEIDALNKLSSKPNAATLYVTLEPCCHWGKTPPCVDEIIKAGIKQVIYGYADPNALVNGKGIKALQTAGIHCELLVLPEIHAFYESYRYWQTMKKPYMTAKIAMTLNGKIAGKAGRRLSITGDELQLFTHLSRKTADAILTTINTILADDPLLNVRYGSETLAKPIYILDSELQLPLHSNIFTTAQSITLFHKKNANEAAKNALIDQKVRCVAINEDNYGLNLSEVIQSMGFDGCHDVWVEAGGTCFAALLNQQLLQRALIYIAPKWLLEGEPAFSNDFMFADKAMELNWQAFGKDVLCEVRW